LRAAVAVAVAMVQVAEPVVIEPMLHSQLADRLL
jgi:hypothetical protein